MTKQAIGVLFILCAVLIACGPETIFVRPSLDTPEQHIANGYMLLNQGKTDDACREFRRANELDSQNVEALVGLAMALGQSGDLEQGKTVLEKADGMAITDQERAAVQKGHKHLEFLRNRKAGPAKHSNP